MLKRLNQVIVVLVIFSSCSFNNNQNEIKHEENTPTKIETTNLVTNVKADENISKECIDMIVKHFDAIAIDDVETFMKTIKPEDGGDLNSEPSTMETFNYYKSSDIYVKNINEYDNYVLEVTIWDPINKIDKEFYVVATQDSKGWGISRYINKLNLEPIKQKEEEPTEKLLSNNSTIEESRLNSNIPDKYDLANKQYDCEYVFDLEQIDLDYIYTLDNKDFTKPKILKQGDYFGNLKLDSVDSFKLYVNKDRYCFNNVSAIFKGEYELTGDLEFSVGTYEEGPRHTFFKPNNESAGILPVIYGKYENYNDISYFVSHDDTLYEQLGITKEDMDYELAIYEYKNITLKCNEYSFFVAETDWGNAILSPTPVKGKIPKPTIEYPYETWNYKYYFTLLDYNLKEDGIVREFALKDLDKNLTPELIVIEPLINDGQDLITVYTYDKALTKLGEYEDISSVFSFYDSENTLVNYPLEDYYLEKIFWNN